ncbi:Brp/Blh family beta-carotene 15,15'-dioxygenase [Cellulophaga sp. Hel_I_12]|uniref:Brp/Blh family beta-carotene 15,15'-dioxygenase n=1 Tax=Cellulophaga sp. Hel_I_12 TaxID=1249972 RepID=UPI000AC4B3A3|nr:Brp/Blh family beta-carotene 15,15'-dioxygenase [Cellulophaga sp. Hel_I_12]
MKNYNINIPNIRNISIVATFLFLWMAIFFEESIENIFAYLLILTFGLIHGANDIKLIEKVEVFKKANFFIVLVYYILFILFNCLLFYFIPSVALILFVLFSAYHFGEQHWLSNMKEPSIIRSLFFLSYGLFIFFLLFKAHSAEVNEVISTITGVVFSTQFYASGLIFSASLVVLLFVVINFKKNVFREIVKELFLLFVFFIVFNSASLLWSFAIYFILWHSIPSLVDQIIFLYGNFSKSSIKKYIKASFFYWLMAVIGLVLALFFLKDTMEESLALFFSFLAAITFPHVLVINKLNHS